MISAQEITVFCLSHGPARKTLSIDWISAIFFLAGQPLPESESGQHARNNAD